MISYSQVLEWREHPVTRQQIRLIQEIHQRDLTHLAKGYTLGTNVDQNTARLVGFLEALQVVLDLELHAEDTNLEEVAA